MTTLLEYQHQVSAAVLAGQAEAVKALFAGDGCRRDLGFRVYANNSMHALVSAVRDTFPAVAAVAGENVFTTLAVAFCRRHPPARDALLIWFGAGFPAFLDGITLANAPWIGDLARLEFAWLEAYHATEALPLPPAALARITPEQLLAAHLTYHPSARLLSSGHNIALIWEQHRAGKSAEDADPGLDQPTCLVLMRPEADVLVRSVSQPVFQCLQRLQQGAAFANAAAALVHPAHFEELSALIAGGLFIDILCES